MTERPFTAEDMREFGRRVARETINQAKRTASVQKAWLPHIPPTVVINVDDGDIEEIVARTRL